MRARNTYFYRYSLCVQIFGICKYTLCLSVKRANKCHEVPMYLTGNDWFEANFKYWPYMSLTYNSHRHVGPCLFYLWKSMNVFFLYQCLLHSIRTNIHTHIYTYVFLFVECVYMEWECVELSFHFFSLL